jgi:hypothetical protein
MFDHYQIWESLNIEYTYIVREYKIYLYGA